jgi:hypothetical protein
MYSFHGTGPATRWLRCVRMAGQWGRDAQGRRAWWTRRSRCLILDLRLILFHLLSLPSTPVGLPIRSGNPPTPNHPKPPKGVRTGWMSSPWLDG